MATLQAGNHPASRIDVGDTILERAKTLDAKPVKARLAAFASAHKAYAVAEREVRAAEAAQLAREAKIAEADVAQDAAVDALATAMAGDGAARTSPFKELGFASPTAIQEMGYAKEAAVCAKLAKSAAAWKIGTAKTKSAAKNLAAAAKAVTAAIPPRDALTKEKLAAIARRDALGQAWRTSLEALKHGARAAEDDGARGLFAALFQDDAKKAKAKKPAAPVVAPASPAP